MMTTKINQAELARLQNDTAFAAWYVDYSLLCRRTERVHEADVEQYLAARRAGWSMDADNLSAVSDAWLDYDAGQSPWEAAQDVEHRRASVRADRNA